MFFYASIISLHKNRASDAFLCCRVPSSLTIATATTNLGDVINGTRLSRESDKERICFVTGGLPVWDVGWSYEVYQNALKLGLGQTLKLWDSPYLN